MILIYEAFTYMASLIQAYEAYMYCRQEMACLMHLQYFTRIIMYMD